MSVTPTLRALPFALFLIAMATQQVARADAPSTRTNILFVLVDQQRQDGVGAYGLEGVQTPHLDRLAGEGIRFTRAYVAQPVCAPNRGSLFSGFYPFRHGLRENQWDLETSVTLLPDRLRARGYTCGYFGKWHLGDPARDAFDVMPDYPRDGRGHGHYYERKGQRVYQTDALAMDAIEFLESHRAKPFLCVVSLYPPHGPLSVPPAFEALYRQRFPDDEQRRKYYAMCSAVDACVGKLLGALERLKLASKTVVVYTSEHGQFFERRWNDHAKRLCYDEAAKVPLLLRLPGRPPTGRVHSGFFNAVDLTPTLLGLLGVLPDDVQFHGFDLSRMLTDNRSHPKRYTVFINIPFIDKSRARHRVVLTDGEERCIVSGRWKWILSRNRKPELYDLESDSAERRNLWAAKKGSETVAELSSQLAEWSARVDDPLSRQLLSQAR